MSVISTTQAIRDVEKLPHKDYSQFLAENLYALSPSYPAILGLLHVKVIQDFHFQMLFKNVSNLYGILKQAPK